MYRYNIRNIFLKGINRKMSRLFNRANSRAGGADRARCLLSSSSSTSQEDLYLWCVATASLGQRSSIFKQAGSPAALIQWQTTHFVHAQLHMRIWTCTRRRNSHFQFLLCIRFSDNETDKHEAALWSNTRRRACSCSCIAAAALLRL